MDEKKKVNKLPIILLIVAVLGIAASITLSVISIKLFNKKTEVKAETVADDEDDEEDYEMEETMENDVVIAEEYTIKDTTVISDAYKSGDTSALDDKQKETLTLASDVLAEIITDGMTDYDKEKAVYDWMCENLSFDDSSLNVITGVQIEPDTPYGVLKYHNAVCVGYATTFRLFMQMMDIECKVVHNTECYHSWDLVYIDDNWYHVDIYSDSGTGDYTNFNLNDEIMMQSEDWDTSFFPAAESLERNVLYQESTELDDIYVLPKDVKALYDNMGGTISYRVNSDNEMEMYAMVGALANKLYNMNEYTYYEYNTVWVSDDEELLIITLTVESENPDYIISDIDEETLAKITASVDEAFDDLDENAEG